MNGLTENQRGVLTMISGLLILIAATQVPDTITNAATIRWILGIAGVAGLGLQKFLQTTPADLQATLNLGKDIAPLIEKILNMPPDERKLLATTLEAVIANTQKG